MVLAARFYYASFTLFEPSTGAGGTTYQAIWRSRIKPNGAAESDATARFSPDSTMLAVACSGRRLKLVDTTTRRTSRKIETRSSTVAFSPDGRTLASGYDDVVGLYDCGTGELQRKYIGRPTENVTLVSAVAFSATGALLFTCVVGTQSNMSGPIFLYDTNDRPRRRELDLYGLGSGIRKTEFSSDGSLLAVVGSNSNVALYDVATATPRLVPRRVPPS